jgi:hypothetical protein
MMSTKQIYDLPEYYFVYNPNGSKPTKKHTTYEEAEREALRSLEKADYASRRVIILKAVSELTVDELPITIHKPVSPSFTDLCHIRPAPVPMSPPFDVTQPINPYDHTD